MKVQRALQSVRTVILEVSTFITKNKSSPLSFLGKSISKQSWRPSVFPYPIFTWWLEKEWEFQEHIANDAYKDRSGCLWLQVAWHDNLESKSLTKHKLNMWVFIISGSNGYDLFQRCRSSRWIDWEMFFDLISTALWLSVLTVNKLLSVLCPDACTCVQWKSSDGPGVHTHTSTKQLPLKRSGTFST